MARGLADWSRLSAWLTDRGEAVISVSWAELGNIVGGLPESAVNHYPQWWHGDRQNTRAWRRAGYDLERVDVGRSVTFRRTGPATMPPENRRLSSTWRNNVRTAQTTPDMSMLTQIDISRT
ncbi:DUF7662 domain-containing protein [Kribbella caucasensis]